MNKAGMRTEKTAREFLQEIGKRGGRISRRELTKSQARHMVLVRELKKATFAAGKPWPPTSARLKKLLKVPAENSRATPVRPHERRVTMRQWLTRLGV